MIITDDFFSILFWSTIGTIFLATLVLFFFKSKKKAFSRLSVHHQIKNLLIISLLSAVSVAVLFLFSRFSSVIVLPNFRTAFSGILVKISGFVFGPIIGLVSALVTELLVYFFLPTYFHYNFLLLLMSFGVFAGLIRYLLMFKIKQIGWQILITYFVLTAFFVLTQVFFYLNANSSEFSQSNLWITLKKNYLLKFNFQGIIFYSNLVAFCLLFLLLNLIVFIIFSKKNYFKKIINKKTVKQILPIFLFAIFAEYFISVPIGSYANQSVFGENQRSGFFLFSSAIFFAPIKIIINTFIIYNVWNALKKHFSKKTFFL